MSSIEFIREQIAYHESLIQELNEELKPLLETETASLSCEHEWIIEDYSRDDPYESLTVYRTCSKCKLEQYAIGIVVKTLAFKPQEEWVWKKPH